MRRPFAFDVRLAVANGCALAAVIIARKIGLMVAFFAFEGQESWLLAIPYQMKTEKKLHKK